MSPSTIISLFIAMAILAAVPSSSVLAVLARSGASGFVHGACTAMGIVAGDLVFVAVAIAGLPVIASVTGEPYSLIRYLCAAYLLWAGWRMLRSAGPGEVAGDFKTASHGGSFLEGLLLTLADQKAVFFYLGFLPGFVDLASLRWTDVAVVMGVTLVSVGGVKLLYAALATRARAFLRQRNAARSLHLLAGLVLIAVAAALVLPWPWS